MRGKVYLVLYLVFGDRITPAHAGKSNLPSDLFDSYGDHPRTCGEKFSHHNSGRILSGSPPHMRGKVCAMPSSQSNVGITPAHAGKRSTRVVRFPLSEDHPRTCGEKVKGYGVWSSTYRITPAHAGKSRKKLRQTR